MFFKKQVSTDIYFESPLLKVKAISNNRIMGYITCIVKEKDEVIEIGDIQCNKNNKGYGSLMMRELIVFGKQNNYKSIEGWISSVDLDHIERLHHFYQKFGFEITPNKDGNKNKVEDIRLKL